MDGRKLLIVGLHFAPTAASGTYRMVGLARHLPHHGWRTIVVAPPSLPWEAVDPNLRSPAPPETTLVPVPYPRSILARPLRAIDPFAAWLLQAAAASVKAVREHRPDAILTTGPPHVTHAVGLYLKRRFGIPWIADFRDPWMTVGDEATPTCGNPGGPHSIRRRILNRLESSAIANADVVATTAPGATELLRTAFPDQESKIITLTNGYDPEAFASLRQPQRVGGPIRLLHAGELYAGRDPKPLLDAVVALKGGPHEAGLRLLGRADGENATLADEVDRRGLAGLVDYLGQVSYERSLAEMAGADILLVIDSPGRRVGIPAKLYEYLGTGRPILALAEPDGDVAWALAQADSPFRIAPPRDAVAIGHAIVELAGAAVPDREPGRDEPRAAHFTRSVIAGRLAKVLDDCLHRSGSKAELRDQIQHDPDAAQAPRCAGRIGP